MSERRQRQGRQNLAILAGQTAWWGIVLVGLHAPIPVWSKAVLVVSACLVLQGVFSMMHEAFHDLAHPNARINRAMGWWASTLFGAPAAFMALNHRGHHVRNRTRAELVEFVFPDESRWTKTLAYYVAIAGGIWLVSFVSLLVLPFVPYAVCRALGARARPDSPLTAFSEMRARDWRRVRLDAAASLAFWVTLFALTPLKVAAVAPLYAAFAVSWSSLQWIYHLRTPLDPIEGAYDLRVPTPIRWLFLNFNYNLQHHRHPQRPWQDLHAGANPAETQPLWYRWLGILRPPEPLPTDLATLEKRYF